MDSLSIENVFPFDEILGNSVTRSMYAQFLGKQQRDENILLLDEIDKYNQCHDDMERVQLACNIFDTFIMPSSLVSIGSLRYFCI